MSHTRTTVIEAVHTALHSYTGVHEQVTYLTSAIDGGTLTLPVGSTDGARRGIAEVGEELVYIDSSPSATDLLLAPFGRGYRATEAAAHDSGVMVTFDPAFPRASIGKALDQVVAGLFPALFQVKEVELEAQPVD